MYVTLAATTGILLFGTAYSVLYDTYLDTSDPVLLSHHLVGTHYFASKSNPLNVYFIKYAWAWTSAVFVFTFLTSPSSNRTRDRIYKYFSLTFIWSLFIIWFFGPPLIDRLIVSSGGECIAYLPSGDTLSVPVEYCLTKSTLTPSTHPSVFETLIASGTDTAIAAAATLKPRLRRGHDISGHVFLLTMSILFLADQLKPSFKYRPSWSALHSWAIALQIVLIFLWLFALYTTAVYFHTPFEKFTGYLLGLASFAVSQIKL